MPPRVPHRPSVRSIFALAAVILAGCVWAGCHQRPAEPPRPAAEDLGPYVGSEACAECHAEIFKTQAASPHARTLAPAQPGSSPFHGADTASVTDPGTDVEYRVELRDGRHYQVSLKDGREVSAAPIDYLLGSGHHGISPMRFDGKEWRYLALTYYAAKGWDFSPMHFVSGAAEREAHLEGWPVTPGEVEKCFGCHATRLEFNGPEVNMARSELGVKCESCHGPGRAHVEAARASRTDLAINNPGKWTSENFIALCAQCHNENSTLDGTLFGIPDDPTSPKVVKHHVYGMQKSRCFTESDGKMRCTTCHDPHAAAETRPQFYEGKCLGCHSPAAADQEACPVNPRTDCLTCHMPKVEIEKYTKFADHWIRARSPFVKMNAATKRPAPSPRAH